MTEQAQTFKTNLSLWAPVGLWMGMIFGLSSMSSLPDVPVIGAIEWGDKIAHALAYAVGGALVWRAFGNGVHRWWRVAFAVLIAAGYGLTDEIHQLSVPMRTFDPLDLCADMFGSAIAATILTLTTGGYEIGTRTGRREDPQSE